MSNTLEKLFDTVIRAAKNMGCEYPVIGEVSDGTVCVVDTADGKTYKIELREF
jgi:hypothetical protein